MPYSFFITDIEFDNFLLLEDVILDERRASYLHCLAVDPKSVYKAPLPQDDVGFIRGLGPLSSNCSRLYVEKDEIYERRSYIQFNKIVRQVHQERFLRSKNIRRFSFVKEKSHTATEGVQFLLEPSITYFGKFCIKIAIRCRVHAPEGMPSERLAHILRCLSPNPSPRDQGMSVRFHCKRILDNKPLSIGQLLEYLTKRVLDGSCADFPSIKYSIVGPRTFITIERAYPWPISRQEPKIFWMLLYGATQISSIRSALVDSIKETDWGMFDDDTVILRKDRAIRAHMMPRTRYRAGMYRYVDDAWDIIGIQNTFFSFFERTLPDIYEQVFSIRRIPKKIVKKSFSYSLINTDYFIVLHKTLQIPEKRLEAPARRAYHTTAEYYRIPEREQRLRGLAAQVISEAERWNMPILGPLSKLVSLF